MIDKKLLKINTPFTKAFAHVGISDFEIACQFIKHLPYQRNIDKDDFFCVFNDQGGTCSTKHALLQRFSAELGINSKLILGIFNMNAQNTPAISAVLQKHHLKEMPEAHTYLKINEQISDFTNKNSTPENFMQDLLQEIEIHPDQITDFKVEYHKKFLENYLKENPQINYSLEEFWQIREECIAALQQ